MHPIDSRIELLLIRHAQSEWNASGRWQGQADPPLSQTGIDQARALADRLATELRDDAVRAVLCSDLQRARQTAIAVASGVGLTPVADPRLRELDVGAWSGLTRDEILERDPGLLKRFEAEDPDARPGGGETRREIRLRARRAVSSIVAEHDAGLIVIVTHLGFLRALLPGVDPGNADFLRVRARDALTRRAREALGPTLGPF